MEDTLRDDGDGYLEASRPEDDNEEECAVAEFSFVDLRRCFEWKSFLDLVQANVLVARGVSDKVLVQTRNNAKDGLACAVAVAHDGEYPLMFVTEAFETLTGQASDKVVEGGWKNALLPSDWLLNDRINKEGMQEIEDFCQAAQDQHTSEAPSYPLTKRVFLLGGQRKDEVYWLLLEIAALRFNSSLHVLFILRALTMPSLEALEGLSPSSARLDSFNLFLKRLRAKLQKLSEIGKSTVVARLLEEDAVAWLRSGRGEEHSVVRRNSLTRQATVSHKNELSGRRLLEFLHKCAESMQVAHGEFFSAHDNIDAFNVLGSAAATLGRHVRTSEYDAVAWVVADTVADFPLVYVSKGFTQLSGYQSTQVFGKNCRFLQPLDRSKNEAINANECKRLKDFCTARQPDSKMAAFMLNQDATGHFFWNLLTLLHVNFEFKTYILGTLTKLSSLRHEMTSILTDVDGRAIALADALRAAVSTRENRFSPLPWHMDSNESVLEECVVGWVEECCREVPELWEGDHFMPPTGGLCAKLFAGRWHSLFEVVEATALKLGPLEKTVLSKTTANLPGGISFCVSDPHATDCPLVFVSKEFAHMTGYDTDFALGRNCRFLLPNDERVNAQLNSEEIKRMRAFLSEATKSQDRSSSDPLLLVSLFIYERRGGERFWCLSAMSVGKVAGHPYLVAVQLPLPCAMPSLLENRLSSVVADDYDPSTVHDFSMRVSNFLNQLRPQVHQQQNLESSQDMRTFTERTIRTWITQTTDDFDGELYVAKIFKGAVYNFQYGRKWNRLIAELAKNEVTAGIAEALSSDASVPCGVADATSTGCPLVYMSSGLEEMTGYSHEWALGRNCKFLQPKLASWNDALNLNERRLIRKFVELPPKKGHITSLMLNEAGDGHIFLNLLVLRHVNVDGHPYIFSMQTSLRRQLDVVSELLLGGVDGIERINQLRNLIRKREASNPTDSLDSVVEICTKQWLQDVPVSSIMRLSTAPPELRKSSIPPVGLELTRLSDLRLALPAAIEEGVRHFVFNFATCSGDALHAQLFHLKVVDILGSLRQKCLHYLRTLAFSIKSKPGQEDVCTELVTSVQKAGVRIALWLLDASTCSVADCLTSWQHLTRAQEAGDVASLGIFGSGGNLHMVQKAVSLKSHATRISVLALDLSPATIFENKASCDQIVSSLQGDKPVMLFGTYGHKSNLLQDRGIHAIARDFNIDPCMVLLKWAEGLGCLCVVPWLRTASDAPNGFLPPSESIDPTVGIHSSFLTDYSVVTNPRVVVGRVASLRPPELKNNQVWFGSVCRGDSITSQNAAAALRHPRSRRPSKQLALPAISDIRDADSAFASAPSTSRSRRRSTGTAPLQESHLASSVVKYVRRGSAGNMSNIPSLEENMSARQKRIQRRSSELPSMKLNNLPQPSSDVEVHVSNLTSARNDRTFTWPSNLSSARDPNSAREDAKEGADGALAEATEYLRSKAYVEMEMSKNALPHSQHSNKDHEQIQVTPVDNETSALKHPRLRRRHSAEVVSDKTGTSDVPIAPDRKFHRRWSTDGFRANETSSNDGFSDFGRVSDSLDNVSRLSESLDNFGRVSDSLDNFGRVSDSLDKVSTEPAIKESRMEEVDPEPDADILQGNVEEEKNAEAPIEAKEEPEASAVVQNGGTLVRRRSSTRECILSGIFRGGAVVSDADDKLSTHTDTNPLRKRTLEPLYAEQHRDPRRSKSQPANETDQKSGSGMSLSESLQARREEMASREASSEAPGIAGFGVGENSPASSAGKIVPTTPSGMAALCQEVKPLEPEKETKSVRSRPGLPFGPQAPVAPPQHAYRRPSKFSDLASSPRPQQER